MAGWTFGSHDRQRRDPRAGGAAELCVRDDQQELVDAFARDLLQPQVLHDHHAVADVERLRDHERLAVVFRRVGAEAPGVTPGQRHPVIGKPLAKSHARTRFARGVPLVVGAPQTAPAGVEEHSVAGPHVVAGDGKSLLRVGHRDHVTGMEPLAAARCGHIEEQAPGHHLGKGVDAKPVRAVILDNVGEEEPVVGTVAHLQVVEPVHVGAHLLGRGDLLHDPVDAVVPQARRARVGMAPVDLVVVGGQVLPERAAGERGDVLVQHVRQVIDPSLADQADRFQNLGGRDLVQRAGLVVRAVP